VFGQTCGDCRLLFFCRRATGAASARPSLRPPTDWGRSFRKARARIAPRDGGPVSSMRCLRCEAGFGREAAACERGAGRAVFLAVIVREGGRSSTWRRLL
jgi:hypothetical protein